MIRLAPLVCCLCLVTPAIAQVSSTDGPFNVERVPLSAEVAGDFPDYYLALPVEDARGMLVLFADLSGNALLGLRETNLPYVAAARGVATVLIPTQGTLAMDDRTLRFTDAVIRDAADRFSLPMDRTVIGGFSVGGTLSLEYAIESRAQPGSTAIFPRAVFAIDAPVDLKHAYGQFSREIEKACSEVGATEGQYMVNLMEQAFGKPDAAPEAYARYSPLLMGEPEGGNARYLTGLPVRLYHEPAIQWQIENRCRGLMDSNILVGSELVNTLRMGGNARAELILPEGRGYRANGQRHPHTWALVEPGDLTTWILTSLEESTE